MNEQSKPYEPFKASDRRRFEGALTETEQQDQTSLLDELDREEEERQRPAMEQMDRKVEAGRKVLAELQTKNATIEAIVVEREALLARVRAQLAQFQAES